MTAQEVVIKAQLQLQSEYKRVLNEQEDEKWLREWAKQKDAALCEMGGAYPRECGTVSE